MEKKVVKTDENVLSIKDFDGKVMNVLAIGLTKREFTKDMVKQIKKVIVLRTKDGNVALNEETVAFNQVAEFVNDNYDGKYPIMIIDEKWHVTRFHGKFDYYSIDELASNFSTEDAFNGGQ